MTHENRKRHRSAFTLVELLVVMAIISVLAALLLPVLRNAVDDARAVACMNNLRQVNVGIHLYADEFGGRLPYIGGNATCHLAMNVGYSWGNASASGDEQSVGWWLLAGRRFRGNWSGFEQGEGYTGSDVQLWRCPGRQHPPFASSNVERRTADYGLGWHDGGGQDPAYEPAPRLDTFGRYNLRTWRDTGFVELFGRQLLVAEAVDPKYGGCSGPVYDRPSGNHGNVLQVNGSVVTLQDAFSDATMLEAAPGCLPYEVGSTFFYYHEAKYGLGWWAWAEQQIRNR